MIWVALATLLIAGALVSQLPVSKQTAALIVLGLSTVKAWLVATYYMHLKYDRRWLLYVVAFPLVVIALAVFVVLSSFLVRL